MKLKIDLAPLGSAELKLLLNYLAFRADACEKARISPDCQATAEAKIFADAADVLRGVLEGRRDGKKATPILDRLFELKAVGRVDEPVGGYVVPGHESREVVLVVERGMFQFFIEGILWGGDPKAHHEHQQTSWWLVTESMFESMKTDGVVEGFRRATLIADIFSIPA